MKRLIAILCLLVMLVGALAGCNPNGEGETTSPETTAAPNAKDILINGTHLSEYVLVFPTGDAYIKAELNKLQQSVESKTGVRLAIHTDADKAAAHEIIVGNTKRDTSSYCGEIGPDRYAYCSDGTHVLLTSKYQKGIIQAIRSFEAQVAKLVDLTIEKNKTYLCENLSTMSFNVLYTQEPARWNAVVELILNYMPDTIGMQETTTYWLEYLQQAAPKFTEHYTVLEFKQRNTTGGKGETRELICFRKDRFTSLETNTKWLSETPNVENTYFADASSPQRRILNYVKLKDKVTGKEVIHANTHLEHIKADVNLKQAKVVLNIMKEFEGKNLLLTGDFNAKKDTSETYKLINGSDFLRDSAVVSKYVLGDGKTMPVGKPTTTIDFCFVSHKTMDVEFHTVLNQQVKTTSYEGYPSDHLPVLVVYNLK